MDEEFPPELLKALPNGSELVARTWWESLGADEQRRIAQLWDERLEVQFFSPQSNERGEADSWENVPRVKRGRFVPHDDDGRSEWAPSYFEHLLQHPELVLAYDPEPRTFHIVCTLHEAARKCLQSGKVPQQFICPFATTACPLESLRGASLMPHK